MRVGIVISNAVATSPTHSTVHIALAALRAGHIVRFIEPWDFEVAPDGRLHARAHCFEDAPTSREELSRQLIERQAARRSIEVDRLDLLLLRVNPLHDAVHSFALLAQQAGVRVLNDPASLPRTNHKGWLATLAGVPRPATLVTRSRSAAERFASTCLTGVVVKPARSCGGKGVSMLKNLRGLEEAMEAAVKAGDGYVVVQAYLPEAEEGEKRLLWLDGRLLGGYLRRRAPGELRHNLKAGATPLPCSLTQKEQQILDTLTPHLRREGIWFAGVDVIGDSVVEVNVLNPGGLHYSGLFAGQDLASSLINSLRSGADT